MYRKAISMLSATAVSVSSLAGPVLACPNSGKRVVYHSQPAASRVVRTVYASHPAPTKATSVTVSTAKTTVTAHAPAVQPALPEIEVGATVTASANFLGAEAGYALLHVGAATMECEIIQWSASSVTFKAPNLGLRSAVAGNLELVRPDGRIVRQFPVQLAPRPAIVVRTDLETQDIPSSPEPVSPAQAADAGDLPLGVPTAEPAAEVTTVGIISG